MAKFEDLLKRPLSEDYLPDEYKHEEANATDLPGDVSRDDVALGYIAPAMVDTVNEMAGLGPSAPVPFRPKGELEDLMSQYKDVKRRKEVENDVKSRMPASEDEGPTREDVRKLVQSDRIPEEYDPADSYDRAYSGREKEMEEANKKLQAANAPKEEKLSEREILQRARIAAQGRDDEMTFLDDIMKAGAIANQALSSQGGYKVAQAKLPSMKTDMASRYDKLIKEYDALKKPKDALTTYEKEKLKRQDLAQERSDKAERRRAEKQRQDEERKKKSMLIPGVGYAVDAKDAKEIRKDKTSTEDAIEMLNKVKEMGKDISKLDPRDFTKVKKIDSLLNQAVGKMRISLTGGGPLTEEERQMIRSSIGDPTSLLSTESAERAKLDQLIEQMQNSLRRRYENSGVEMLESPSNKDSGYSPAQERGIEVVMKKNNISRKDAIEALKKAGKL